LSAQKVNLDMSSCSFGNQVGIRLKKRLLRNLCIGEGSLPFTYLGVLISMKRLLARAFELILEKVRQKLSTWKAKSLSFADRITLLKVVL